MLSQGVCTHTTLFVFSFVFFTPTWAKTQKCFFTEAYVAAMCFFWKREMPFLPFSLFSSPSDRRTPDKGWDKTKTQESWH